MNPCPAPGGVILLQYVLQGVGQVEIYHKTVAGMLQRLGSRFGLVDRTLCMDRGMVTQDSLKLIRESKVRYVLADRRGASERFPEQVQQGPWLTKRTDPDTSEAVVEVQEVGEEEGDRLILVRSRGCAQKEKGIHDRMLSKLKAHLERLQNARWKSGGCGAQIQIEIDG